MEKKKEKQMTIDDYLNSDNVVMFNADSIETVESVDRLDVEAVDYNTLTKGELVGILTDKDIALSNYADRIENLEKAHKVEVDNLTNFCNKRTTELSNLVQYYERKLRVLKDIITIEVGGEK